MTEQQHGEPERLISARQLEAEGVIQQASPPRAFLSLENGLIFICIAAVVVLFATHYGGAKKGYAMSSAHNRGVRLLQENQQDKAIAYFDKAIALNPNFAAAFAERARANFQLGRYQQALRDYDAAIRLETRDPNLYQERAYTHQKLHDAERAIQDFDKVIAMNPRDARFVETYVLRGVGYRELGRYEQAMQDFDAAIGMNPRFGPAYAERGVTYLKQSEYGKAEADFDKARAVSREDKAMYDKVEAMIEKAR